MEWSPETALKAYLDTVKTLETLEESNVAVAELVSAMAGGSKAKLTVEAWCRGGDLACSIGLSIASRHSCGRHVCVVEDEMARAEYVESMERAGFEDGLIEVVVGEAEEVLNGFPDVDFAVVDCRRRDYTRFLRFLKLHPHGALLVSKNATNRAAGFKWHTVLGTGARILRSKFLPVEKGVEITQVAAASATLPSSKGRRWITQIDRRTGEEHVFRR